MKTLEEIYNEIDARDPVRPVWQLATALRPAIDDLKNAGQNEDASTLIVDWYACSMVVRNTILTDRPEGLDKKEVRLTGYVGNSDGSSYPDPSKLTPADKDYLSTRADKTSNPILKAHFKDVLFETTQRDAAWKKCRPQLANEAIESYLQSARLFAGASNLLYALSALDHAAHLSIVMRKASGGDARLHGVIKAIVELLESQALQDMTGPKPRWPRGRWVVDLARLLARIRQKKCGEDVVSDEMIQRAREICLDFVQLHSAGAPWDEAEFYRTLYELAMAQKDSNAACQAELGRLEAMERAAEARGQGPAGDPLARTGILQQVVQDYEHLRNDPNLDAAERVRLRKHIDGLRRTVRGIYQGQRGHYREIKVPLDISADEINQFVEDLLQPEDIHECLDRIASEGSLLPNVDLAEEQARTLLSNSGMLQIMPATLLSEDNLPVARVPGAGRKATRIDRKKGNPEPSETEQKNAGLREDEGPMTGRLALERDRSLLLWIGINTQVILHELFVRLKKQKGLTSNDLIEHFDHWGLLDEDNREILLAGFDQYMAGNGIAAMHILAPQFEDVFRSVLDKTGTFASIKKQKSGDGWEFGVDIRKMLASEQARSIPREIREYIRLVFIEQIGWNLRNRVAHGLVTPAQCTLPMVETVLHLFLLLTLFKVGDPSVSFPDMEVAEAGARDLSERGGVR